MIYVSHILNLKCSTCRKSFENFLKEIEDFFVFIVYAGFAWMYIIVVPAWSDHGSERKGSDAWNRICTWLSAIMWAWGSNSGSPQIQGMFIITELISKSFKVACSIYLCIYGNDISYGADKEVRRQLRELFLCHHYVNPGDRLRSSTRVSRPIEQYLKKWVSIKKQGDKREKIESGGLSVNTEVSQIYLSYRFYNQSKNRRVKDFLPWHKKQASIITF